ncbi:hypothetical protein OH492_04850 [Vibrio chagasii]|nr:hypothetical protein [Vibrio chagasii]
MKRACGSARVDVKSVTCSLLSFSTRQITKCFDGIGQILRHCALLAEMEAAGIYGVWYFLNVAQLHSSVPCRSRVKRVNLDHTSQMGTSNNLQLDMMVSYCIELLYFPVVK